jgi:hypothetical protein
MLNQISGMEAEGERIQKALDSARASYQTLNKQYQEQCGK